MKKSLFTILIILTAGIAVILISSCPSPITEALVAAVEDSFDPVIIVYSPDSYSTYHSTVVFEGRIIDSAISDGDGRGTLRSLFFTAGNQSIFKGGILVDFEGTVIPDTTKGLVPISYNPVTGDFSFTFDSSAFSQNIMEVFIVAVDQNGNEHEISLSLYESDGPVIDLQVPDSLTTSYVAGGILNIEAILSDSISKPDTVEEISQIIFSCPDLYVTNVVIVV